MEKYIDKFIEYLKVQKNYSEFTRINYEKDLMEYSEFLKNRNYDYNDMDYKKCMDFLIYLDEKNYKKNFYNSFCFNFINKKESFVFIGFISICIHLSLAFDF